MNNKIDKFSSVLVTGGAGFIGSSLIQELNKQGYENIYILDTMRTPGKHQNLVGLKFKELRTSLGDWDTNGVLWGGKYFFDIGIHLGAITNTKEQDFNKLLDVNVELSKKVYRNCKKFIYASSSAVYDEFGEEESPINAYGFSKLLFDNYLRSISLDKYVYGLRFTNVYGQREQFKNEMCSIVYKYIKEAVEKNTITTFNFDHLEDAEHWVGRDFISVNDITQVIINIMEHNENYDSWPQKLNIMDVGTGRLTTFSDLSNIIRYAFYKNPFSGLPVIKEMPFPKELLSHYQYTTCANIQQVSRFINNFTSIKKGVEELVNYFLSKGI